MKKINASLIEKNSFTIRCPKCQREHKFTLVSFNKYYLDEDELDTFELTENARGTHDMWPWVVCRNKKCRFEDAIQICNL